MADDRLRRLAEAVLEGTVTRVQQLSNSRPECPACHGYDDDESGRIVHEQHCRTMRLRQLAAGILRESEDRSAGRWCDRCRRHGSHHTDQHDVVARATRLDELNLDDDDTVTLWDVQVAISMMGGPDDLSAAVLVEAMLDGLWARAAREVWEVLPVPIGTGARAILDAAAAISSC